MAEQEAITIRDEAAAGAVVVRPSGDIDMARSPILRQAVREAHERNPSRLVVDLQDVAYMDSSGLATLVEGMRTAKSRSTDMVICGMNDRVRAIFQIARLDQFFTIVGSVDEALAR